eukprot:GFYU01016404.1.p1 GENE.GFYU01016404.1~~GFYU01016404.1.p1  ORF type:complete len:223 (-),score=36.75 GFYU01016404.1:221-889(-)
MSSAPLLCFRCHKDVQANSVSYSGKSYCHDCFPHAMRDPNERLPKPGCADAEKSKTESSGASREVKVCTAHELLKKPNHRMEVTVGKKTLLIMEHNKELYAMDAFCYHMGGPLMEADIEDLGKHNCIKCPWHMYLIDIKTGEGMGMEKPKDPSTLHSKGRKQRVYPVRVDKQANILVTMNDESAGDVLESDRYAVMGLNSANSNAPKKLHSSAPGSGRQLKR